MWEEPWKWQATDSVYDNNNVEELWLTPNNGSHAVALGNPGYGWWTTVAAEARTGDVRDSVCAYEWMNNFPEGTAYEIWKDGVGDVEHPGYGSVAANNSFKFWMESDSDLDGNNDACRGATEWLGTQGVQYRVTFDDEPNQNGNPDHTNAGLVFPDNSARMVGVFSNVKHWESNPDSFGLNDKYREINSNVWYPDPGMVRIVHYGATYKPTQPSLAVGSGSDVYLAYNSDPNQNKILFKISTNYGEDNSWGDSVPLGNGDHPCVAAIGQFVFVCWHGSDSKIHYRFSNDAGSLNSWKDEVALNWQGGFSQTNVSAITCNQHPGQYPGVLLVSNWSLGASQQEFFALGERFTANQITWSPSYAVTTGYNAEVRPSLVSCNRNSLTGRCFSYMIVHVGSMFQTEG